MWTFFVKVVFRILCYLGEFKDLCCFRSLMLILQVHDNNQIHVSTAKCVVSDLPLLV